MTASATGLSSALGGRYLIERELGRGGMATVYLADDVRHRRKVAMKVLHRDLSSTLGHERFLKEIELTASLQHPHILPLFDSGIADGQLFYVMPFVDGETLGARLNRGPLPAIEGISVLRDVAKALAYAHGKGVVHRDIKPENVLLSANIAVVSDFGIAKAVDASRTQPGIDLTEAGVSLGTPAYMAPEQALGDTIDARTDVYAWGVIAYEVVTGAHPFAGKTTAQKLIAAHIADRPAPIAPRADLPVALTELIARSLSKSPSERPDFAEVIRVLDGALSSASVPVAETPRARVRTWRWKALVGALVVVAVVGAGWLVRRQSLSGPPARVAAATSGPSLVVLPFTNMGGVPENEIFADGVTEDVITHLATVGGLTVISRTSAMTYKGTTKPLKQIAAELGVGAVLEGSVRRVGSRVRVVAQLIDAKSDAHKWAGTFDRELADVFAIQSEIAQTIADTLKATLSPETRQRLAARPTTDTLAYQLYLRGRAALNARTAESFSRGITLFEQAIQRDSGFALPYSGLASLYALLPLTGPTPARPSLAKARAAVERALTLDPNLPLGHATRAYILMLSDYDWAESEQEFRRAVAEAPNETSVRSQYASFLAIVGRADESIREARLAVTLDPKSSGQKQSLATTLLMARRYDEALVWDRRSIEQEPGNLSAWTSRWAAAWYSDKSDEAIDALVGFQDAARIHAVTGSELRRALATGGRPAVLRVLLAKWPVELRPAFRAVWYAELRDPDHAMEWLERGYDERWISLPYVLRWQSFASMKGDPRFVAFTHKMGLEP